MTWPSLTCSRLFGVALAASLAISPLVAGTVSGRIELRDSKDPAVRKGRDFSGVVVWFEPVAVSAAQPPTPIRARMVQKDKTFTPHILAIPVGSTVDFPNFDPIFHNAFSNYNGTLFDIGLYAPGSSRAVRFSTPGVVRVFCNIHAQMSAVILALNTPYFATSQKDGTFRIANVPPGDYTMHVFHERASEAELKRNTHTVAIPADTLQIPAVVISESGYLAIPHSNKYGHDYATPPDDGSVYPAVRK